MFGGASLDGFKIRVTGDLQQATQRCEPPPTPITDLVRSRRRK